MANNVNKQRADGWSFSSSLVGTTSCVAAAAADGKGTMRQRNLNAQCKPELVLRYVFRLQMQRHAAGCGSAPTRLVLSLCVV